MNTRFPTWLALLSAALCLGTLAGWHGQPAATAPPAAPPAPTAPADPSPMAPKAAVPVQTKYIKLGDIDIKALLPTPTARGSAVEAGEVELVLAIMQTASPEERKQAEAEVSMTAEIFADVLGPDFSAAKRPKALAWLMQAARDAKVISDDAKGIWERKRPYAVDARIPGDEELITNAGYPSGHATRAMVWATLLTELYPDKAEALLARARVVGYHRIVLGVHFPSDVAAGNALGVAVARKMLENEACKADMEAAKAER